MKKLSIKEQVYLALMAGVYVALTLGTPVISMAYGAIQFRISEFLNHLLIYNKKYIISLGIGVAIVNSFSTFGIYDVIFGTGATLLCSVLSIAAFKFIKSKLGRFIFNTLNFSFVGMIPITFLIIYIGQAEEAFFTLYGPLVLSELIIMTASGILLYTLDKKIDLKKYIG
ncbi:QueT transporter family protein [Carnobacteriaceae bacterium zg-ZUI78]|uniref:QueT transporter family protein n=1 Tax=Granulicatella sp. zg-84 TaxID=2678503 RepID=UPI0013C273BE|nr:QueT transporter family protein [Granulicatella sp. zg-84]MBS4750118.1 QueT transporter family protein [Carnobacteriaceae bacterium zg-ZUI78]NEW66922.1 QueT transporter family protein [Granulicatella sp. zg-84]QMI86234.1 QueT transporter family protein [Carnobacteriaceae bacterium zg-84]